MARRFHDAYIISPAAVGVDQGKSALTKVRLHYQIMADGGQGPGYAWFGFPSGYKIQLVWLRMLGEDLSHDDGYAVPASDTVQEAAKEIALQRMPHILAALTHPDIGYDMNDFEMPAPGDPAATVRTKIAQALKHATRGSAHLGTFVQHSAALMEQVGEVVLAIRRRRLIHTNADYFASVAELAMLLINFVQGSPLRIAELKRRAELTAQDMESVMEEMSSTLTNAIKELEETELVETDHPALVAALARAVRLQNHFRALRATAQEYKRDLQELVRRAMSAAGESPNGLTTRTINTLLTATLTEGAKARELDTLKTRYRTIFKPLLSAAQTKEEALLEAAGDDSGAV